MTQEMWAVLFVAAIGIFFFVRTLVRTSGNADEENANPEPLLSSFKISFVGESFLQGWDYKRQKTVKTSALSPVILQNYAAGECVNYAYSDVLQVEDVALIGKKKCDGFED